MKSTPQNDDRLGAILYESLRAEVAGEGSLSFDRLARRLGEAEVVLPDQAAGEVMIGCMFAAALAAEQSRIPGILEGLRSGLDAEFIRHLREQGAPDAQIEEWKVVLYDHFNEYYRTTDAEAGAYLPDFLGKEFFWNLTGQEDNDPRGISICGAYLSAARFFAAQVLARCTPRRR